MHSLWVSTDEFCASVDLINNKGVLAYQFENAGPLPSDPVQEIHEQVEYDLHGPHLHGPHRHAEGQRLPPAAFAWCPLLQEPVKVLRPRTARVSDGFPCVDDLL